MHMSMFRRTTKKTIIKNMICTKCGHCTKKKKKKSKVLHHAYKLFGIVLETTFTYQFNIYLHIYVILHVNSGVDLQYIQFFYNYIYVYYYIKRNVLEIQNIV